MHISTNVCNWAELYKMQLLAIAVIISGSAGQTVSRQDEVACSWLQDCWTKQKQECWNASFDNSFNIDRMACCQHDNETTVIELGNLTSAGDSNITSPKFPVTSEEGLLGDTEGFDALKIFVELGSRVDETIAIGISQNGISITSNQTEQMNKFNVTLNVNATTNPAQSSLMIGFIKLKKALKEFEDTPTNLSYLLSELGVISVAMYSSWKPTPIPLEITYDYDLDFNESFKRYLEFYSVENITVKCVQLEVNGTWVDSGFSINEANAAHARCKCSNCSVLGVKQEFIFKEKNLLFEVFFRAIPVALIIACIFLGLSASLLVIYRRQLNSRATFIHVCITLSFFFELAITTAILLAYVSRQHIPSALCEGLAILLLYFRFTLSCWILVEGAGLLVKIGLAVYVNYENVFSIRKLKIIAICAWLLPGIIIGVTAGAEIQSEKLLQWSLRYDVSRQRNDASLANCSDGNYHFTENVSKYWHCYPKGESISYILCDVVTGISCIGNLLVSSYVAWIVWKKSANRSNTNGSDRVCTTVNALVTISLILGAPQGAAFMIKAKNFALRLIVANVLLSLQGPIVFYFYCVKNPDLVQAIKLSMNRP